MMRLSFIVFSFHDGSTTTVGKLKVVKQGYQKVFSILAQDT